MHAVSQLISNDYLMILDVFAHQNEISYLPFLEALDIPVRGILKLSKGISANLVFGIRTTYTECQKFRLEIKMEESIPWFKCHPVLQ